MTSARGGWALWRLAGRILADMAHTKGWGGFVALRSGVRSVQEQYVRSTQFIRNGVIQIFIQI